MSLIISDDRMADDDFFLGYCLIHSSTERALFSAAHAKRLFALAGVSNPNVELLKDGAFVALHEDTVSPLVKSARARLAAGS